MPLEWKLFKFCMALCLALMLGKPAGAQTAPAEYKLAPDDLLEITVRNHSDLDRTVKILPDGTFTFPEVGEVKALGLTTKALASLLQSELDKTLNNAGVVVSVKERHSERVRVIGAVKTGGSFDLKSDWRLLDLLAAAGGLSVRPTLVSGRIVRGKAQVIPLQIDQAVATPEGPANVALLPDDLVLLDEVEVARKPNIYIMGQVAKPGPIVLEDPLTLLSALSAAGNPTPHAALSRAYVLRGSTSLPLNLHAILVEGKSDPQITNFKFQSGDVLFVPENEAHYSVMGEAKTTGYYPLPERGNVTVLQALTLAGGQGAQGDLTKAGIIRNVGGKPTVVPINLQKMLKTGDLAANVTLQPDDILYIPAKGNRGFSWQELLSPLAALSVIGLHF